MPPVMTNSTRERNKNLRLLIFILIAAALACSLPVIGGPKATEPTATATATTPPTPTPTPEPLPPDLVESDPPLGGEMALQGPITLHFNQAMDHSSVENALIGQFEQEITFTWTNDRTLVMYFSSPLDPESELQFNLESGALSAQGMGMLQPISLRYITSGYLQLTQMLPENETVDVDPTSAVIAAFNRPVVPLGGDPAALPAAFSLSPAAQGRGEWINTSTYAFYPEPPLAGGQLYTVSMKPDLKSVDGGPFQEVPAWSFTTAPPRLLSVSPSTESLWPLDAQVDLTFNQPMDPGSLDQHFSLLSPDGNPVVGKAEWDQDTNTYTFTPTNNLARNSQYTLSLDGQAQASGGTQLGDTRQISVTTVPQLLVYRTEPSQGGELPDFANFVIYFSTPVDSDTVLQKISFTPQVPNLYAYPSPEISGINLRGDFTPSSEYTLSIDPSLTDIWGGALGEPYTVSFRTSPLRPSMNFQTPSEAIFLTPQDTSIQAQVANVYSVPIFMGSLSLFDFFTMLGPNGYEFSQNYQSADQIAWSQPLNIVPDINQPVEIPLQPDGSSLSPGLYQMRINLEDKNIYTGSRLIVVSNINLIYKVSPTDALVWAVDLRNNAALTNAPVNLYDQSGNLIASGQTDGEGMFYTNFAPILSPYDYTYAVIGQPGQDIFSLAISNWSSGIEPWDFDVRFDPEPPSTKIYYYTDRPIYRPGQTVYFRAVVRQAYNGRYDLPEISSLPVVINSDQGTQAELLLGLSTFGSAHGSYQLPDNATPGYYQINSPDLSYSAVSFQVANYRKPEINLSVTFSQEDIQAGSKLQAQINARYFFDAPAGNVSLHWALYAGDSHFNLPGYRVGLQDTDWMQAFRLPTFDGLLGAPIDEGDAETNPDGTFTLEFPTEASDKTKTYRLEVTLEDETGFPISARAESEVHPSSFYIGVRPDAWVYKAGDSANFEVLAVDWQQEPIGERSLRAEFMKVVWERIEPTGDDPFMGPEFIAQYTPIASTDFSTSADGQARLSFVPPEAGTYQLNIFDPAAPSGTGARTEVLTWVSGPTGAAWPNLPNSRLRLTADRESYIPGDTAQIFIPNPFGNTVQALVSVERGIILNSELLTINAEGYNYNLPLSAEHAPNVYLAVTLLGRTPDGKPDFRHGYTTLEVEPSEQTLKVQITSQPERTGPGEEVSFDVLVSDAAGQPVQGEFSLAVVDQAVLALADPNSPDIVEAFFSTQPLGVRTAISAAAYGNRLYYFPPGLGGGGGGALAPFVAREDFPDTAYWNAEIVTDAEGKAQVRMNLPDTLTTWQVDTRGLTQDTRVGEARSEIVTTKELLIRPVVPRFLVAGDRVLLAAIAQNNTTSEMQVEVSLNVNGVALESAGSQQANLPANGRVRLEWWAVAQDVPSTDLVFAVQGQSSSGKTYSDASRPAQGALPVLHYTAPRAFRTSGTLDGGGDITELVSLPASFDSEVGEFSIELAPSLGAAMINALEVLEGSPHESTETTISRFLPNLETFRVFSQYGIESETQKASLDRTLNEGLQRLQTQQNQDGGWGWWTGGESDPYVTAYALFGLVRAQEAGISINVQMLQNAVSYLQGNLDFPSDILETWQLDRLAFEHFVLASYGASDLPAVETLAQYDTRLSPWARALLALTLQNLSPGNPTTQSILSDLGAKATRSATGAHWEFSQDPAGRSAALLNMHTALSNSAVVVYAQAQLDPGAPLLAEALRYLMAHRDAHGCWGTTYTTAWNLMALTEVVKGTGELGGDFNFSATLNKNLIAEGQAGGPAQLTPVTAQVPIQRMYPDYPNALQIQRSTGSGRLYYTAGLLVSQPVEQVAPLSQGLSIERAYYPTGAACPNDVCDPVGGAQAGDRIKVRLTVSLPQDAYYLAVEDYIPAGSEILDTRLKTSQLGEFEEPQVEVLFDPRNPFAKGWGWWLFNEEQIYDDHITWTADYLPAGTYELTYTIVTTHPGSYQTLPTRAWQLYFPEVQANSAGQVFEIRP